MPRSPDRIRISPEDLVPPPVGAGPDLRPITIMPIPVPEPQIGITRRNSLKHMWFAAVFLIGLAGFVVGLVWRGDRNESDWIKRIADRAERSVVRLDTADGHGTAFVVASHGNRHLLLTNRHVMKETDWFIFERDAPRCTITLRAGTTRDGYLVGVPSNNELDMALVLTEAPGWSRWGQSARSIPCGRDSG